MKKLIIITWFHPNRATFTAERGRQIKLSEIIDYDFIIVKGARHNRVIPKGFMSDLRSGGRLCDLFIPKIGDTVYPSIMHDDAYREQWCSRLIADNIMLEACRAYEVKTWRIVLVYYGLRWFGWIAWNRNKKKLEKRQWLKQHR